MWKLKHANSILETFEYFCQISSKLILIIIFSYTVSKLVRFWDTVYLQDSFAPMYNTVLSTVIRQVTPFTGRTQLPQIDPPHRVIWINTLNKANSWSYWKFSAIAWQPRNPSRWTGRWTSLPETVRNLHHKHEEMTSSHDRMAFVVPALTPRLSAPGATSTSVCPWLSATFDFTAFSVHFTNINSYHSLTKFLQPANLTTYTISSLFSL